MYSVQSVALPDAEELDPNFINGLSSVRVPCAETAMYNGCYGNKFGYSTHSGNKLVVSLGTVALD